MNQTEGRVENPKLLDSLKKVREDRSEANMLNVLTEIISAKLILPVEGTLNENCRFHAVTGSDDKVYQVVYSDSESFDKAFSGKKQNGVVAGFMDICDLVLNGNGQKVSGFVINPGFEEVVFGNDMLQMIVDQFKSEGADFSGNVKVGDADRLPDNLEEKAIEFCRAEDDVKLLYILLMQRENKDVPEWLFVLGHTGDREILFTKLSDSVGPYLDGLGFVIVDAEETFAKQVCEGKTALYEI